MASRAYSVAKAVTVVTGAGSGIGRAICQRFAADRAKVVACVDIDVAAAQETAALCSAAMTSAGSGPSAGGDGDDEPAQAFALRADVSREGDIRRVITQVERRAGPIDYFVANAGILSDGGAEVANDEWQRIWGVNTMQHVYVARHLVPRMTAPLRPDGGCLVVTSSAAGLLTQIGSMAYSVTKAATVSAAEWLAITHGEHGLRVTCLCPQAVETAMTAGISGGGVAGVDGMITAEACADALVESISRNEFLCLPHKEVKKYMKRKADDTNRWISGMQRLQARYDQVMKSAIWGEASKL